MFPYGDGSTEDGCDPSEPSALADFLNHKTTPQQAAYAITRYKESFQNRFDSKPALWALLTNALLEFPELEIPRLIGLLAAIQNLPSTDGVSKSLWKDLPGFGHSWADHEKPEWFK
jgi:hypothetical protein